MRLNKFKPSKNHFEGWHKKADHHLQRDSWIVMQKSWVTWCPRCRVCGHLRRFQRGTRGADARQRPRPRRCAPWTHSWHWSPDCKRYQNRFLNGSFTWFASTVPFMSQRQSVWSSLAESRCPFMFGFQDRPYLYGRFNHLTSWNVLLDLYMCSTLSRPSISQFGYFTETFNNYAYNWSLQALPLLLVVSQAKAGFTFVIMFMMIN